VAKAAPYVLMLIGLWIIALGFSGRLGDVMGAVVAPDHMIVEDTGA
jgi:hypothetical protein